MAKVDAGIYNKDQKSYETLINELYDKYPDGVTLPPEYGQFVQEDLLRFLIRLARYKFVARLIKKTDRVLEVGCGSGLGSIFLGQHCAQVKGIDIKTTEIEEAKAINQRPNVSFDVANLFLIPKDDPYDVVIALDVIEHFPEEEGAKLISAMCRVLKPNGMLVIGSPSIYSFNYQSPLSQASHVKCYDQKELQSLIEKYCQRTLPFSMNDEMVHTGYAKMAWYYFILGFCPTEGAV